MAKLWEEFEDERAARRLDATKIIGKSISLVNEPEHQRFWLPNRDYIYDMRVVGTRRGRVWRHTIIHNETQRVIEFIVDGRVYAHFDVPLGHLQVGKLNLYAQELATRRYPRPYRRDGKGRKMKEAVLYTVVNVNDRKKGLMEATFFLHQAQQFKAVQTWKYPGQTFEIYEIEREG